MPDPNVPYAVEEVVDWDPDDFETRRNPDGLTISGPCPRCGHEVDTSLRANGYFGFDDAAGEAGDDTEPAWTVIRCNCRHAHEGGAAGQGCGRYWGADLHRR